MSRARAIATAIILTIFHPYVSAQAPPCQTGYEWSYNSLKQTPCDMAETLGGVCVNNPFILHPLLPDYVYIGPTTDNENSCLCSTVYYSLLSACANCQNRSWLQWLYYQSNCTKIYIQVFHDPIPPGTKIPHYAYLDVVTDNNYNVIAAENAGGPESTPASQPTSTSATSITTSTTTSISKKVNIGAIVGGVVGGVAVIGIAACLIAFMIMRRRRSSASTPSTYTGIAYASPQTMMSNSTDMRLYDPNDPTTFPSGYHDSPNGGSDITPAITAGNATRVGGALSPVPIRKTQYSGAPEL